MCICLARFFCKWQKRYGGNTSVDIRELFGACEWVNVIIRILSMSAGSQDAGF